MSQLPPRSGLVPIVGEVRDDGRVVLFRPLPVPPRPRPQLRLITAEEPTGEA